MKFLGIIFFSCPYQISRGAAAGRVARRGGVVLQSPRPISRRGPRGASPDGGAQITTASGRAYCRGPERFPNFFRTALTGMSDSTPVFEFGCFVLNAPERLLLREGRPGEMTPRACDLLLALVRARGHLLEKDELLRTVWEGSFVEEGNVNRQISTLRRILGDEAGSGRFIETVPKRGYRFIAPVRQVQAEGAAPFSASSETPSAIHTSFDHSKDAPLATPPRRAIAVLPFKI